MTHMDKGTRGVSSNADLLVGHGKLETPALIQVKSCVSSPLGWVFFGGFPAAILTGEGNSKPGFHANFIATVSIKSPKEYRVFILPVSLAESRLKAAYKEWHGVPTKKNEERKPVPTMYVPLKPKSKWGKDPAKRRRVFGKVTEMLLEHEDSYHLLLGERASVEDVPSLLNKERGTGDDDRRLYERSMTKDRARPCACPLSVPRPPAHRRTKAKRTSCAEWLIG